MPDEKKAATEKTEKDAAPKTNLDRLSAWIGHSVSVMTITVDHYGTGGVLLNVDDWGIELQARGSSNSTFVPWAAVIQVDHD